ncbi:MAG: NAD-glutamate dehydrogenase [Chakrabartia sp.]
MASSAASLPKTLSIPLGHLLVQDALPGELQGFGPDEQEAATAFLMRALAHRPPGQPSLLLESIAGEGPRRRMRIGIVNDDMPFLVDSVAAEIAAHGLAVDRVLHPVIGVTRSPKGALIDLGPRGIGTAESVIYLEVERAYARVRHRIEQNLRDVLAEVRAAVADWPSLRAQLDRDAARLADTDREGAALLRWFAQDKLTLLGHAQVDADGQLAEPLGICRLAGPPLLSAAACRRARDYFAKGGAAPLLLKSNRIATVHRRVPIELVVLPSAEGLSLHAGLWTSAAMHAAPGDIPVLRQNLAALQKKRGFDPAGHAGKALTHAVTALQRDLLIAMAPEDLEAVALAAMSLADRPRPSIAVTRSPLARHLHAFVWLPRDELSTARRQAITELVCRAAQAPLLSWAMDLEESGIVLIRLTIDIRDGGALPDVAALNAALTEMVRGWRPAVEAALAHADAASAPRLALRYADAFPAAYREGAGADEAARDIARIAALEGSASRGARLYRKPDDAAAVLRLKLYSLSPLALSDAVPALENFGFRVMEELPTALGEAGRLGHIHRFVLALADGQSAEAVHARAALLEPALEAVLEGRAENDRFNQLMVAAGLDAEATVLLRALFRYLRQTGLAYGLQTVAEALRRAAPVTGALIALFRARHDPAATGRDAAIGAAEAAIEAGLAEIAALDDDRILRLYRAVIQATLRTNMFVPAGQEALAFKLDSAAVPGLPDPKPWREIFVYAPRVEGIHLRAGPVARGGLRWSDRRDDFRTEILGLMKAQRVKNAVIVPTGAKGGFYPKMLPDPADREAWLAEGTESYRIFIRALLSVTDNLVAGKVVPPAAIVRHDGDDPYFVVAADKGTASFSDVANAIALDQGFWLGDAFASGGSVGYDHKAMGITARGAWLSVRRHFAEMGVDVQKDPVRVIGCGDMSGDVFGNGMLLSQSVKLVAAFDHRHIFLDPDPDPATSWAERARLFALPRSSWADYDAKLISKGGGVFARTAKTIPLSAEMQALLGVEAAALEPAALISALLKAEADLLWFGGIGTYVKAASEAQADAGDRANDGLRVNAEEMRVKVIGEGANLGVTQAGRIAFALKGGRINTDFIDNSAGVDCSDNEVNIKIALNADLATGQLTEAARNALLVRMTEDVAHLVLEDNRLQTLALSIAERGGADAVPAQIRLIEGFEAAGKLDRAVEGLAGNEALLRRAADGHGLTRPELAVLMATAKLALQAAIEHGSLGKDPATEADLLAAFPAAMRSAHRAAILGHRLRDEIVATKIANRLVNRMGLIHPFELAEEEGATLGDVAEAFVIAEQVYDLAGLWQAIEQAEIAEHTRLVLFEQLAIELRAHMADILRNSVAGRSAAGAIAAYRPAVAVLGAALEDLLPAETRRQIRAFGERLAGAGAPPELVAPLVRLAGLDGAIGIAALSARSGVDVVVTARAFTAIGAALGLDWAQGTAMQLDPRDPWERLLAAGLARDFQAMRLDFLGRLGGADPQAAVVQWQETAASRIAAFRAMVERARTTAAPSTAMLAQIAGQARVLLNRA